MLGVANPMGDIGDGVWDEDTDCFMAFMGTAAFFSFLLVRLKLSKSMFSFPMSFHVDGNAFLFAAAADVPDPDIMAGRPPDVAAIGAAAAMGVGFKSNKALGLGAGGWA